MATIINKVLVPVDFSENSEAALEMACRLAEKLGAGVVLVHVIQALANYPLFFSGVVTEADLRREMEKEAENKIQELARERETEKLKIETRLRFGEPYEEIVAGAREEQADLVVMGTHGRTGISRALIGSVAERVVRKAVIPVLTVPFSGKPPAPARRLRKGRIRQAARRIRIRRKKPSS